MHKLRVGILRGGPSSEYEVSLKTGAALLKNLPEKYSGHDIFISRDGLWHRDGAERDPHRALAGIDVVVNGLHGEFGEDGRVQKILDTIGIPYTGSDALASAIGMNKHLTKQAYIRHEIKTPYYTVVRKEDDIPEKSRHIFNHFLLPFVVKPASAGSSVGVSIVKSFAHLPEALEKAFAVSDAALVEEYIRGREATCGVVENFRGEKTYTLLPIEIIHEPHHGFFNYEAKYSGTTQEICPGNFSNDEKEEIMRLAKLAHEALGLRHYSRSDMMISPRRGIYVLETNTLPGMTEQSLLPRSLEAIGCSFSQFVEHIINLALE